MKVVGSVKWRSQDSRTMCCGVESMWRGEALDAWTRTWLEERSGMVRRTWSSKGGSGVKDGHQKCWCSSLQNPSPHQE